MNWYLACWLRKREKSGNSIEALRLNRGNRHVLRFSRAAKFPVSSMNSSEYHPARLLHETVAGPLCKENAEYDWMRFRKLIHIQTMAYGPVLHRTIRH